MPATIGAVYIADSLSGIGHGTSGTLGQDAFDGWGLLLMHVVSRQDSHNEDDDRPTLIVFNKFPTLRAKAGTVHCISPSDTTRSTLG